MPFVSPILPGFLLLQRLQSSRVQPAAKRFGRIYDVARRRRPRHQRPAEVTLMAIEYRRFGTSRLPVPAYTPITPALSRPARRNSTPLANRVYQ